MHGFVKSSDTCVGVDVGDNLDCPFPASGGRTPQLLPPAQLSTLKCKVQDLSWFLQVSNVGAVGWVVWVVVSSEGVAGSSLTCWAAGFSLYEALRGAAWAWVGRGGGIPEDSLAGPMSFKTQPWRSLTVRSVTSCCDTVSAAGCGRDCTEHEDQMDGRLVPWGESCDEILGIGHGSPSLNQVNRPMW